MVLNKMNLVLGLILFSNMHAGVLVNVKKIIPSVEIDLKYATTDNFVGKRIYNYTTCYLLSEVAEALKAVQAELSKQGLGIKIFDGYRTMQAQRKFWEVCPDERYVSNPDKEMGRHTRGTAVDLTLINLKTKKELEMPTGFDDFTEKAAPNYKGASKTATKNRTILQRIMRKHGFTNNKTEWWHFDFNGWQKHKPLNIEPKDEDVISF